MLLRQIICCILRYFFYIRHHTPSRSRQVCTSIVTNTLFVSSHLILFESDRTILVGALFLYSLRVGCRVPSYRPFEVTILCPVASLSRIAGPGDPPCLPIPILLAGGALG